jgi:hypothetical protein
MAEPVPTKNFLLDVASVQLAAQGPQDSFVSRIDFTDLEAVLVVGKIRSEGGETRSRSFSLAAPGPERLRDVAELMGLEGVIDGQPMEDIPYGTDRPWRYHWAALLLDAGQYGFALEEPPYGLRYRNIFLEDEPNPTSGSKATLTVAQASSGMTYHTVVPVPVPAHLLDQVVGIGFTIREWINDGEGRRASDGSLLKILG